MMKPHKHAELIKAWADGAKIQIYTWTGVFRNINEPSKRGWVDVPYPTWNPICDYRIKPTKVVRWLWAYCGDPNDEWRLAVRYMTETEAEDWFRNSSYKKLEWSREEFDQ